LVVRLFPALPLRFTKLNVFTIQHYVIKFVSYLRQVGGFLRYLWFPLPIKITTTI